MRKREIRYTVIIPCYNAAETITQTLDSLVCQQYKEWEAICVDDCSVDNTASVIQQYIEEHAEAEIKLLCNAKNGGPGVSRNKALEMARGHYFCFLDADDYYAGNYFTRLDEVLANTDADIILFGCNQVIGGKVRRRPKEALPRREDYIALVGGSLCLGLWRNILWQDIQIPPISNAEDIAVIPILISRARKVISIPDCLYYYIHSNNSTSSRDTPQVSHNFVFSFRYTLSHINLECYNKQIEFHGIKTIMYGATLNAMKAGMSKDDIRQLWAAFEPQFPLWRENPYLQMYSKCKRLFIWLAGQHLFPLMRLYAWLHTAILKVMG